MLIIALIGIDGCGKTTQAKMLLSRLTNEGFHALYIQPILSFLNLPILSKIKENSCISPRINATKEFSKSEKGHSHKKKNLIKKWFFIFFGYFYAICSYLLIRLFSSNNIVICDRFFYQFFYDIYGEHALMVSRFFPRPNLVFFLDIQPELAYSRMASEYDTSIKMDYYSSVTEFYNKLNKYYSFKKMDANVGQDGLNEKIFLYTRQFILKKHSQEYENSERTIEDFEKTIA